MPNETIRFDNILEEARYAFHGCDYARAVAMLEAALEIARCPKSEPASTSV